MYHVTSRHGRFRAPAPAVLLLALCLLAVGAQALTDPADTATPILAPATNALAPFPGTHLVPGLVQAEDFDAGGEGVAYHDTEPANLGGAYRPSEGVDIETGNGITDVGWVRSGEWLTYTVNTTAPQSFVIEFKAANPDGTPKRVNILIGGAVSGEVFLSPTGSFDSYTTSVSSPLSLLAGETTINLSFAGVDRVNLDYLDFELPATPEPALLVDTPGLHTLSADLPADGIGVLITSSNVVFDGMGHSLTGTDANGSIGVYATGPSFTPITNVTIRNLTARHWADGIRFGMVSDSVVEDVVAEQNRVGLIYRPTSGITNDHVIRDSVLRENTGSGLDLSDPAEGFAVERCSITGNGVGVSAFEVRSSNRTMNHLADCDISGNAGNGLDSSAGSFAVVGNCTIRANGDNGLKFEHGGAEIVGNHIEENAGAGVDASDRGGCNITSNVITGNGIGILAGGDWPSHVRNNTDNGFFGIPFDSGYLNFPKTAGTNIVGGPYLGGNFWASPDGTGFFQTHPDLNQDGICDVPYVITEDATDFLPLAPAPNGTPNVSTPFKPHSVPGRVEAEDYDLGGEGVAYHDTTPGNEGGAYRHDDVDIEKLAGLATPDVGWIRDGEYLVYTVNVTTAGTYDLTASMASPNDGRTVVVFLDELRTTDFAVPNTGSFESFRTAFTRVDLTAGTHTLKFVFQGDGENLDWLQFAPQAPISTPFKPLTVPGTIQAEDYNLGGEGVAYHDTTPGNEGGVYRHDDVDIEKLAGLATPDVGWIRDGEYLIYTVNTTDGGGVFDMTLSVASPNNGRSIDLAIDGVPADTIAVPNTGSFSTFRTVSTTFGLAGRPTLKLTFHGDGQNIDWIAFSPATFTTPTPTPTPVPSGGASFVAVPTTAPYGSAVKFTVTPASGKSIGAALWSFDAPAHLNTWNSRAINPTFFYPARGTFSPQVQLSYTDGSAETVRRANYITAT
ncbi:MAG: carbohydrate-binding protein [Methanospirillum sp.]